MSKLTFCIWVWSLCGGFVAVDKLDQDTRARVERAYVDQANRIVQAHNDIHGSSTSLYVRIEFDEAKIVKDRQAHTRGQETRQNRIWDQLIAKANPPAPKPTATANASEKKQRFGRLNIDVDPKLVDDVFAREQQRARSQNVNVALAPMTPEPFTFDAIDYVTAVNLTLFVPEDHDPTFIKAIEDKIKKAKILGIADSLLKVSHEKIPLKPTAKPTGPTEWLQGMWQQGNMIPALFALGLIASFVILLATVLMGRGFTNIAKVLGEMKPQDDSGGGEFTLEANLNQLKEKTEDDDDVQMAKQALTQEMKTIREKMIATTRDNSEIVAEAIRDMFYRPGGMKDIRDLLAFIGFDGLTPALKKLPPHFIGAVSDFVEESISENTSLINGVEASQKIYESCHSRILARTESGDIGPLKEALVSIDDDDLISRLGDFSPEQLALMLRTMTIQRGNQILENLDQETLNKVMVSFSQPLDTLIPCSPGIIEIIQTFTGKDPSLQFKRKLISRVAATVTFETEQNLLSLLAGQSPELIQPVVTKFAPIQIMSQLSPDNRRIVLDAIPFKDRARMVAACPDAMKTSFLDAYEQGSKLRDMMQNEIDLMANNQNLKSEIERNANKLLTALAKNSARLLGLREQILEEAVGIVAAMPLTTQTTSTTEAPAEDMQQVSDDDLAEMLEQAS